MRAGTAGAAVMFDIGFAEIVLVMVIALLVVGPERLPRLARTAGLWIGKARAFVQSVREDIEREVAAEELKRVLQEPAELGKEVGQIREIIEETEADLRQATALDTAGARRKAGGADADEGEAPAALPEAGQAAGGAGEAAPARPGDGSEDGRR